MSTRRFIAIHAFIFLVLSMDSGAEVEKNILCKTLAKKLGPPYLMRDLKNQETGYKDIISHDYAGRIYINLARYSEESPDSSIAMDIAGWVDETGFEPFYPEQNNSSYLSTTWIGYSTAPFTLYAILKSGSLSHQTSYPIAYDPFRKKQSTLPSHESDRTPSVLKFSPNGDYAVLQYDEYNIYSEDLAGTVYQGRGLNKQFVADLYISTDIKTPESEFTYTYPQAITNDGKKILVGVVSTLGNLGKRRRIGIFNLIEGQYQLTVLPFEGRPVGLHENGLFLQYIDSENNIINTPIHNKKKMKNEKNVVARYSPALDPNADCDFLTDPLLLSSFSVCRGWYQDPSDPISLHPIHSSAVWWGQAIHISKYNFMTWLEFTKHAKTNYFKSLPDHENLISFMDFRAFVFYGRRTVTAESADGKTLGPQSNFFQCGPAIMD